MTITIDLIRPDLARVTRTPSTLARIVLGRQTEERHVVHVGEPVWCWTDTGLRVVEPLVLEALHVELERVRVAEIEASRCRCAIEARDLDAVGADFAAVGHDFPIRSVEDARRWAEEMRNTTEIRKAS